MDYRSEKSWCAEFSWDNQHRHLTNIDDVLDKKSESIITYVGTNDLTNDVHLLSAVKIIELKPTGLPLILHWASQTFF